MVNTKKRYTILVLLSVCMILLSFPQTVDAQVYVVQSTPAPESQLAKPPESIQLQFSQSIHTVVSRLWLNDEQGQSIEAHLSSHNDKLVLDIPTLEKGIYEVHWRVMGLDAYVTDGSFRFTVGEEVDLTPAGTPSVSNDPFFDNRTANNSDNVDWIRVIRVVELLTVVLTAGLVLFRMFLWSKEGDRLASCKPCTEGISEIKLFVFSVLILMATSSGQIFHRAYLMTQTSFLDQLLWDTAGTILISTFLGVTVAAQVLIMSLLAFMAYRKMDGNRWRLILILGLMFTLSFTSHAYHSQMLLPHTIHLLATTFWLAGLLGFTWYSFQMKQEWSSVTYLHQRLQHFSTLSVFVLFIVIITGFMLSMVYMETWGNLIDSGYGQTLLWKMVVFAPVLLIAAWHRWVWWPALNQLHIKREGAQGIRIMLWGLRIELVLAMVVIVLAGMLSQTSPPGDLHQSHDHDGVNIHLTHMQSELASETIFRTYVLKDRKRLQNAQVTLDVWNKEHEELFINIEDYCVDNNMRFELFRDALIERGFIQETIGEMSEDGLYIGQFQLEPGLWNVGVWVEHADDVNTYQDFTVEVE